MGQNHLIVMDPLEYIDRAMDTSIRMALALAEMGDRVFMAEVRSLKWSHHSLCASAAAHELVFQKTPESVTAGPTTERSLDEFATIHMRKDPPFDMHYITATWLLETAKSARIYNEPRGLRGVNEKLAILNYPDAIRPALVGSNVDELINFIEAECNNDAVLKPLTLFSGKGIHRITLNDTASKEAARRLLKSETENESEHRLIQPFDPKIFDGEVRAFVIGGEPLAWCLKTPKSGEFMANSSYGSTRQSYTPTEEERERVCRISKDLLKEGISVVGYDLIGGYVSEVNVTSPRLMVGDDDRANYFTPFAEWVARS